jgi:hypothetical protein
VYVFEHLKHVMCRCACMHVNVHVYIYIYIYIYIYYVRYRLSSLRTIYHGHGHGHGIFILAYDHDAEHLKHQSTREPLVTSQQCGCLSVSVAACTDCRKVLAIIGTINVSKLRLGVPQEGLGLVVHFPLGCVAKINKP